MEIQFEPVIGLEVHIQLCTESKMFCACKADVFGCEPGRLGAHRIDANSNICPVCVGLPGTLPVLNKKAVLHALRLALALGIDVEEGLPADSQKLNLQSCFHRKSYFYPDLPKGYQITQHDEPLGKDGTLFATFNSPVNVRIKQIHLEEDPGASEFKILDSGRKQQYVDYNRCGVPLIEVVTEPQFHSAPDASEFFKIIWILARYLQISKGQMEKGNLRCDANVSLRRAGEKEIPTYKREIKNINSFDKLNRAILAEIRTQEDHLRGIRNINPSQPSKLNTDGRTASKIGPNAIEPISQCTLSYDENSDTLKPMRRKETVEQYRYFREPDILPFRIPPAWVEEQRVQMPLPLRDRFNQLTQTVGLSKEDAEALLCEPDRMAYFERASRLYSRQPSEISNWMKNDLSLMFRKAQKKRNDAGEPAPSFLEIGVSPESLAQILVLIDDQTITRAQAKELLKMTDETGEAPNLIVAGPKWNKDLNRDVVVAFCESVLIEELKRHPKLINDYNPEQTNSKPLNHLIGATRKQLRIQEFPGHPSIAPEDLKAILNTLLKERKATSGVP